MNQSICSDRTRLETKFDGVRDDLALVKGGHARSAMVHNLPRIADEFGFQFIAADAADNRHRIRKDGEGSRERRGPNGEL